MKYLASISSFVIFSLHFSAASANAQSLRKPSPEWNKLIVTTTTRLRSQVLEDVRIDNFRTAFTLDRTDFSTSRRHPLYFPDDDLTMFHQNLVIDILDQDDLFPLHSAEQHSSQSFILSFGLSDRLLARTAQGGIGAWLLHQAMAFGYQYATEKTKERALSDIDYLQLPKNTGIVRTMEDVIDAALQRGYRDAQEIRERNQK